MNDLVKKGYEKAADDYAVKRNQSESIGYLEIFSELIEKGKTILDVGCGAGKPVDEFLVKQDFVVNGIEWYRYFRKNDPASKKRCS